MGSGTSISGVGGGGGAATLDHDAARKIGKARKWLLAISILTFVTGLIFFGIQRSEVEKQIREAAAQIANIDPATRDAIFKEKIGMTWDQAIEHDRGQVKLTLGVNIALAAIYLGLFFWARRNALGATVTALILFITVHVINAVVEPETIHKGILVKILFVAALGAAISAAQRERKLAA
jgi:hypothetical protein